MTPTTARHAKANAKPARTLCSVDHRLRSPRPGGRPRLSVSKIAPVQQRPHLRITRVQLCSSRLQEFFQRRVRLAPLHYTDQMTLLIQRIEEHQQRLPFELRAALAHDGRQVLSEVRTD